MPKRKCDVCGQICVWRKICVDTSIGAIGMEKWDLIPDPRISSIDLTALRKREFAEFLAKANGGG